MSIVTWVLSILAAVAFAGAGGMKLATPKPQLRENPQMGWTDDFSPGAIKAVGAAEVLGALGLVLPWWLDVAPVLSAPPSSTSGGRVRPPRTPACRRRARR